MIEFAIAMSILLLTQLAPAVIAVWLASREP
jgi:hypothetical protein